MSTATIKGTNVKDFETVTPSDSVDLSKQAIAIYVGTGGDVVVTTPNGEDVTLKNLADSTVYPFPVSRIKATNTTATDIIALYGG